MIWVPHVLWLVVGLGVTVWLVGFQLGGLLVLSLLGAGGLLVLLLIQRAVRA